MIKSQERIILEKEIQGWHDKSYNVAMRMMKEEFNGNLEAALSNPSFIERMQREVRQSWQKYLEGYKKLEELERKEGFPAMHAYAKLLDLLGDNLPRENRRYCYYPFSGVDFYWARIFQRIKFEDIGFDLAAPTQNMWWDLETYQEERRKEIVSVLQGEKIIPLNSKLEFLSGDSNTEREDNNFNKPAVTLLIKGGHDVIYFFQERFIGRQILFGAIITVKSHNPVKDIDDYLLKHNYKRTFSPSGENFLAPYSTLTFEDIHIFRKD